MKMPSLRKKLTIFTIGTIVVLTVVVIWKKSKSDYFGEQQSRQIVCINAYLKYRPVSNELCNVVGNFTNSDLILQRALDDCNDVDVRCAMSITPKGRLGNLMGQYATLYALSKINKRPAVMTTEMATVLQSYFKVSLPVISNEMFSNVKWSHIHVNDWMEESYTHLDNDFILLNGYPCSYTFYHHLRNEIKREFTLHDWIQMEAEKVLKEVRGNKTSATFVGVHVRRGDYIKLMKDYYKGVLADRDFFTTATSYFRRHYKDAIFVVTSDDMDWCIKNIDNSKGDLYFVGNNDQKSPIKDFSILVKCNHTIFTFGTFGYWAAYLTGGDVIYLTNYTQPDSLLLKEIKYEKTYLQEWIPVAAELTSP
ncbi:fucosyltransferase 1 (galactoside 2-alpha-L-fucosyltransferase, H blood group) [Chamberlinius hualienensis]